MKASKATIFDLYILEPDKGPCRSNYRSLSPVSSSRLSTLRSLMLWVKTIGASRSISGGAIMYFRLRYQRTLNMHCDVFDGRIQIYFFGLMHYQSTNSTCKSEVGKSGG